MASSITVVGRIVRQGPQAPLPGDSWALPVYEYEVVEPAGPLRRGERIHVAHGSADTDDPGFAPGRLRRLELTQGLPPRSTLLFERDAPPPGAMVWFCPSSAAVDEPEPREGGTR